MAEQQVAAADGQPPCDEHERKQLDTQHCEGLCLCDQVTGSPALHLSAGDGLIPQSTTKLLFSLGNDALVSISQIHPKPPPKHIS